MKAVKCTNAHTWYHSPVGALWPVVQLMVCLVFAIATGVAKVIVNCNVFSPWLICGVSWWRHQMETFSALLAICTGNSPVPVNSPHKGQWRGALMFSLICPWINDWLNNREAGDFRRHRGHYDVNVMCVQLCFSLGGDLKYNAQNEAKNSETYGPIFMISKAVGHVEISSY